MSEETYQIEKILAKRRRLGVDQYHIKWAGFSKAHNTWEPKANMLDPHLVNAFEADWAASQAQTAEKSGKRFDEHGDARAKADNKRSRKAPSAPALVPATDFEEGEACEIELRQHLEELCVLRLRKALAPAENAEGDGQHADPISPAELFSAMREVCEDGVLTVRDRARLEDLNVFLTDERVATRTYVWAAEPMATGTGEIEEKAYYESCDRFDRWARDLLKRERAAVVQLKRKNPIGSDLFILPPKSAPWNTLVEAGAALSADSVAVVLVSSSR